ncbi:hypothetical protein PVAP13_4KG221405 [Panicum virgatum]|uniref:Uncharacterized protein n=1 Tax=Panicum virgatum TaxID=38727 RepID=A0A8T0TPI7_PANVG|nr:hypothetical protein PVAP13_4KG221405 [Panicum virgatum]
MPALFPLLYYSFRKIKLPTLGAAGPHQEWQMVSLQLRLRSNDHGTILTAVETKQCQLTDAVVGKWVSGSNGLAERVELACLMKLASWATFFRGLLPVEE